MPTLLLTHPDCLKHEMGAQHPERPDRLRAVADALSGDAFASLKRKEAPLADIAEIELLHPAAYVDAVRAAEPKKGHVWLDPDTAMSPGSWNAALRATGAAIYAVDQVMTGAAKNAFCATRPPGHHAEPNRAMGFCFFNNVAIAAEHARAKHGAERVAVVDFDVHHGNGTQAAFWSDRNLFYASTHQMPLYPGHRRIRARPGSPAISSTRRCSAGDGGRSVPGGIPQPHPAGADEFRARPAADLGRLRRASRRPAGADSNSSRTIFPGPRYKLAEIADKHAGGRVVSVLEGGYDLNALAESAPRACRGSDGRFL